MYKLLSKLPPLRPFADAHWAPVSKLRAQVEAGEPVNIHALYDRVRRELSKELKRATDKSNIIRGQHPYRNRRQANLADMAHFSEWLSFAQMMIRKGLMKEKYLLPAFASADGHQNVDGQITLTVNRETLENAIKLGLLDMNVSTTEYYGVSIAEEELANSISHLAVMNRHCDEELIRKILIDLKRSPDNVTRGTSWIISVVLYKKNVPYSLKTEMIEFLADGGSNLTYHPSWILLLLADKGLSVSVLRVLGTKSAWEVIFRKEFGSYDHVLKHAASLLGIGEESLRELPSAYVSKLCRAEIASRRSSSFVL